jgi:hypothetical protein
MVIDLFTISYPRVNPLSGRFTMAGWSRCHVAASRLTQ